MVNSSIQETSLRQIEQSRRLNDVSKKKMLDRSRKLLRSVNFGSLAQEAVALHRTRSGGQSGLQCTVEYFACGTGHLVYTLKFSDGEEWVARLRVPEDDDDDHYLKQTMLAEVAVMDLVGTTSIPVPKVYDTNVRHHNKSPVGAWYMFMSKMKGRPLDSEVPESRLAQFAEQYGTYSYELSRLRYKHIGPMHEHLHGELLRPSSRIEEITEHLEKYLKGLAKHSRPDAVFSDSKDYLEKKRLRSNESVLKSGVADDQIFKKACAILSDLIRNDDCLDKSLIHGPFPLVHWDLDSGNILVDNEYKITAWLDWEAIDTVAWEEFACWVTTPRIRRYLPSSKDKQAEFLDRVILVMQRRAKERNDHLFEGFGKLCKSNKPELFMGVTLWNPIVAAWRTSQTLGRTKAENKAAYEKELMQEQ